MSKRILLIIIAVIVVGLAVGGYFYWKKYNPFASWFGVSPESQAIDAASKTSELLGEKASQGVLPDMNIQQNPLGDNPDLNPVNKTNPFKVNTNPFTQ